MVSDHQLIVMHGLPVYREIEREAPRKASLLIY
jgi:hypothetical protein